VGRSEVAAHLPGTTARSKKGSVKNPFILPSLPSQAWWTVAGVVENVTCEQYENFEKKNNRKSRLQLETVQV